MKMIDRLAYSTGTATADGKTEEALAVIEEATAVAVLVADAIAEDTEAAAAEAL